MLLILLITLKSVTVSDKTQSVIYRTSREHSLPDETLNMTPVEIADPNIRIVPRPVSNMDATQTSRSAISTCNNETSTLDLEQSNSDTNEEEMSLSEGRYGHFMTSLDQFLQTTTFHGLRYILDKSEFQKRRYDLVKYVMQYGCS